MKKIKKFFINFVAGFVPSRAMRGRIRKMLTKGDVVPPPSPLVHGAGSDKLANYRAVKQKWNDVLGGQRLLPARFEEYDFIFVIGVSCLMTDVLDFFKLRVCSSPFEWTVGIEPDGYCSQENPGVGEDTRFVEKIDAIVTKFKNFYRPQDFVIENSTIKEGQAHQRVINVYTKIRFLHLFPCDKSIENAMPEVQELMDRRSKRFLEYMDKSDKILICWGERMGEQRNCVCQHLTDAQILDAIDKLKRIYPDKQIDFVFFEHDGVKHEYEFDKIQVADSAYRIRSNHYILEWAYSDKHPHRKDRPPILVMSEAMDNIRLSSRLKG